MPYQHPGHAFLDAHGPLQREVDVETYGEFLLRSAGLNSDPPVDLARIYQRFTMPLPQQAPLAEQQGILLDGDRGLILIKADDPRVRQRFTEGHELMELLFEAQEQRSTGLQVRGDRKERLCDRGAAALLMPQDSFRARLSNLGCSMASAKSLAQDYQTSLLATLLRMMQLGSGGHGLVVWRLGWPEEGARKGQSRTNSMVDPSTKTRREPPQLRVWWRSATSDWPGELPPIDQAAASQGREVQGAAAESVIELALQLDQFLTGTEVWFGGAIARRYAIEALPIKLGQRQCLVSLFHDLGPA